MFRYGPTADFLAVAIHHENLRPQIGFGVGQPADEGGFAVPFPEIDGGVKSSARTGAGFDVAEIRGYLLIAFARKPDEDADAEKCNPKPHEKLQEGAAAAKKTEEALKIIRHVALSKRKNQAVGVCTTSWYPTPRMLSIEIASGLSSASLWRMELMCTSIARS